MAKQPQATGGSQAADALQQIPDVFESEEEPTDFDSHKYLVHQALQLMKQDFGEQTWRAFWRMAIDNQPANRVAEELGMKSAAVRQAKYRVLARLRQELDGA